MGDINIGQSKTNKLVIHFVAEKDESITKIQIAIKNNLGIFYFIMDLPLSVACVPISGTNDTFDTIWNNPASVSKFDPEITNYQDLVSKISNLFVIEKSENSVKCLIKLCEDLIAIEISSAGLEIKSSSFAMNDFLLNELKIE